jgi:RIO-like serine/threonine protein kinase
MSDTEVAILRQFRAYRAKSNEMLFLNSGRAKSHPREFARAVNSLMERKLVVKERPRDAYSLTPRGYAASLSA